VIEAKVMHDGRLQVKKGWWFGLFLCICAFESELFWVDAYKPLKEIQNSDVDLA
jgi:hypothetical protein